MKFLKIHKSTKYALIDDEDELKCAFYKWRLSGSHTERVCTSKRLNGQVRSLANYVMKTISIKYDHKDRDILNNQKINLRVTTNQLNQANRIKDSFFKESTSQYKGVSWHKMSKKWRSYIIYNNRYISLGYFDSEIDAAKAYNDKALGLFGEFAYLNKVNEKE